MDAAQALLGSQQPRTACWRVYGEPSRLDGGGRSPTRECIFVEHERLVKTPSTFTPSHHA
jgi:hypothetical protein